MIETKEKIIGDSTYSVTQMPAMRALRTQARLLKLLGPAIGVLLIAESQQEGNGDKEIGNSLMLLASQLDEKNYDSLMLDLTQGVRKNGMELNKSIIDMEFSGKLNEFFLVIQFILEVNYADFFQGNGLIKKMLDHLAENEKKKKAEIERLLLLTKN